MNTQSCAPYRGFNIDIHVTANNIVSIDGRDVRYSVHWSIFSTEPVSSIASLPEDRNFLSSDAAFSYGERRAHTFIDACVNLGDVTTTAD
ncbi:hypothetical protein BZM27_23290 [Paraburkholderia steynii]|uniref:Uncharacterized protein n=1 Tax=Paraburkholderia steynii TaxID=1245441 RepID=A0A4R0X9U9_9BURK|nr:hypothetical protein BZM27_23290 [Paraburkholderia steynii]